MWPKSLKLYKNSIHIIIYTKEQKSKRTKNLLSNAKNFSHLSFYITFSQLSASHSRCSRAHCIRSCRNQAATRLLYPDSYKARFIVDILTAVPVDWTTSAWICFVVCWWLVRTAISRCLVWQELLYHLHNTLLSIYVLLTLDGQFFFQSLVQSFSTKKFKWIGWIMFAAYADYIVVVTCM